MTLTQHQLKFVKARAVVVRYGRWLTILLAGGYAALLAWIYVEAPLLIRPLEVLDRIETGSLARSRLLLMAGLLPVVLLIGLTLIGICFIGLIAAYDTEKKYLTIIARLLDER